MYTFLTWQRLIQLAEVKQKRFKQFYSFPFMKSNKSQRNNKKIAAEGGGGGFPTPIPPPLDTPLGYWVGKLWL